MGRNVEEFQDDIVCLDKMEDERIIGLDNASYPYNDLLMVEVNKINHEDELKMILNNVDLATVVKNCYECYFVFDSKGVNADYSVSENLDAGITTFDQSFFADEPSKFVVYDSGYYCALNVADDIVAVDVLDESLNTSIEELAANEDKPFAVGNVINFVSNMFDLTLDETKEVLCAYIGYGDDASFVEKQSMALGIISGQLIFHEKDFGKIFSK